MNAAKPLAAMMVAFFFASGPACPEGVSSNLEPRIETSAGAPKLILPPALLAEIRHSFPGYRVPSDKETIREWASDGDFPYAAWGDFDGNGLTDVALILISDEKWTLAVFHQQNGRRYSPMPLLARPIRTSDEAQRLQTWELSFVQRGTPYKIEHWDEGKTPLTIETLTFPVDAFQLGHLDNGAVLFHWSVGAYQRIDRPYD